VAQWLAPWLGTALGMPVNRHRDWRPLRGRNWCGKKADYESNSEGEGGICIARKEKLNHEKAVDKIKNKDEERSQSFQKDRDRKATRKARSASATRRSAKKAGRKSR
jgi:hypothetical protein